MASFVLRAGERAPRIKLGVRQKCPDLPNLRNYGLTVERELLRILGSLQRRHGYAFASEDTLRAMFHQDTGHMPGVGTIAAALLRMEYRGECESRWIHRGGTCPDGTIATVGCRRIRLPSSRNERRRIALRAPKVNRRESVSGRLIFVVPAFQPAPAPPRAPNGVPDGFVRIDEKTRARELARLQAWFASIEPPS